MKLSPVALPPASASVVIPTYNRRSTLARTLEGVLHQISRDAFEIIVVDDCSSDDTQQYMNAMVESHPQIVYVRHGENEGRVATRNDGIKVAQGDVMILLDDDNLPEAGFVDAHRRVHQQAGGQRVAVIGNVRFASDCIEGSNFGRFLQSRYLGCRSPRDRMGIDYANLPSRCFGTLNCSARRSDLVAVGLFDARFRFYGGEDEDMGYSLRRSGVRIVFAQDARTVHHDEVSIQRYRAKLMESARYGLAATQAKSPEYIEETELVLVLPIDWRKDSLSRLARKLLVGLLCNPPISVVLEWWATRTDGVPWLYSQPLYRVLTASWLYRGYRLKGDPDLRVEYGDSYPHADAKHV